MIASLASAIGTLVAPLVVMILFLVLAKGSGRMLGSVGALLILLDSLIWFVSAWILPELVDGFRPYEAPAWNLITTALQVVFFGGGVILLGRAVIVGRGRTA